MFQICHTPVAVHKLSNTSPIHSQASSISKLGISFARNSRIHMYMPRKMYEMIAAFYFSSAICITSIH